MKTQKNPIGNDFNANIVQENFLQLFQFAHSHDYRTTEPTEKEGKVGDLFLVNLSDLTYIYAKFPAPLNWQRAQLIESTGGYDDLRVPGTSVQGGASAPNIVAFGPSGNLFAPAFSGTGATVEDVFFSIQMPHSWKEGSTIYPHIHWTPTDAAAGNVKWTLEYSISNVNGTFPAPTVVSVVQAASGTAWKHQVIGFGPIDMTGMKLSAMLHCRLSRNPADAQDTYASRASFLEFDCHFLQDAIGSSEQFVK